MTVSDPSDTPEIAQNQVYTVFSVWKRRTIITVISAAALVSPLTATIYLPLLPLLSNHFKTDIQAINLTITVYVIFQALAPLLFATASDHLGRRPIYLLTLTIYILASLGLALNRNSYPALICLRALQSLGASAVLSINYGTVVDITVPARRGKILGIVLAAGNVGTSLGPVLGGWIAFSDGSVWWVFWSLVIFGCVLLLSFVMLFPETARNIVGNGSTSDKSWNYPLWRIFLLSWSKVRTSYITRTNQNHEDIHMRNTHSHQKVPKSPKRTQLLKLKSPLAALRIIFYRDTFLIIWISSSFYALWYCIQASIPTTFKASPFSYNDLKVGLTYLPGSIGVIVAVYLTGKALDHNYKHLAQRAGFTIDTIKGDNLSNFPIEQARSRWCTPFLILSFIVMTSYGWAIERQVHVSVLLVLQFLQGFLSTILVQCYATLLVDIFPERPSTAATAGNVSRCVLAAVAVATIQPLSKALGKAWYFTVLGVLCGIGGLASQIVLRKYGMRWRDQRNESSNR